MTGESASHHTENLQREWEEDRERLLLEESTERDKCSSQKREHHRCVRVLAEVLSCNFEGAKLKRHRAYNHYKKATKIINEEEGFNKVAAEVVTSSKIALLSDEIASHSRTASLKITDGEVVLEARKTFLSDWERACDCKDPPVFYSLYKRSLEKYSLPLLNTGIPVLTLVQRDGEEKDGVLGIDAVLEYYNKYKPDDIPDDKTFFVILPQLSPGCVAAHEFLRLLYVMLDAKHNIPRFILADDDVVGCGWVKSLTDKKEKTYNDGTIQEMVRALAKYANMYNEEQTKPMIFCFLRNGGNVYSIQKNMKPAATTVADSFLLIERNDVILKKPFYPSKLLCMSDEKRETFKQLLDGLFVDISRDNTQKLMPARCVYWQHEDYFMHMLLAEKTKGRPLTTMLQGAFIRKSGTGNTSSAVPPVGITKAEMYALCRWKCMEY
ncbi:hypothetical protein DIPPA_10271 [Diplonema papillatum]|nr:hypothetical protein DIPPA_10271 [Diplonema papillatum]